MKLIALLLAFYGFASFALAAPACKVAISKPQTAAIEKELAHLISELQTATNEERTAIRELLHNEISKKIEEYFNFTGKRLDLTAILKKLPKDLSDDSVARRKGEKNKIPVRSVDVLKELKSTLNLTKFGSTSNGKVVLWDGYFYDSNLNDISNMTAAYTIMNTWVPTRAHDIKLGKNYNSDMFAFSTQHQGVIVFDQKSQILVRLGQDFLFKGELQSNMVATGEDGIFVSSIPQKANYVAIYHNHQDKLAIWNPKTNSVEQISKAITRKQHQANHLTALENQVILHYFERSYLYDLNTKSSKKLKNSINPSIIPLPTKDQVLAIQETDSELSFQVRLATDFNKVIKEAKVIRPRGWWDIVGFQFYEDTLFIQSKRANGDQVTATIDLKSLNVKIEEGLKFYLGQGAFLKQASMDKNRFGHYSDEYLIYGDKVVPTPIKMDEISIDPTASGKFLVYSRDEGVKLLQLPR